MAYRDALPNLSEFPSQLRWDPDEDTIDYVTALSITVGEFVATALVALGAATMVGVGTDLQETLLAYELSLPHIGTFPVLVTVAFIGLVATFPVLLNLRMLGSNKEHLMDDIMWVALMNAFGFFVGAFQGQLGLSQPVRAGFFILGGIYLLVYLGGVVFDYV